MCFCQLHEEGCRLHPKRGAEVMGPATLSIAWRLQIEQLRQRVLTNFVSASAGFDGRSPTVLDNEDP